jgi:hypothetical protein
MTITTASNEQQTLILESIRNFIEQSSFEISDHIEAELEDVLVNECMQVLPIDLHAGF